MMERVERIDRVSKVSKLTEEQGRFKRREGYDDEPKKRQDFTAMFQREIKRESKGEAVEERNSLNTAYDVEVSRASQSLFYNNKGDIKHIVSRIKI